MTTLNLEKQIARIPLLTKIINTESCLLLYSYLALYGKTTPAELRQRINLSKATIFRSLAQLTEAEIIAREVNNQVTDKRYNVEYYISETLADFSKFSFSMELREYAKSQEKSVVLEEWLSQLEFLPLVLNQLTSQLMISTCEPTSSPDAKKTRIIKTLIFRLKEEENYSQFHKKLIDFVEDVDSVHSEKKRNMKDPMKNPVAFSVSVVAYDDFEIESENIVLKNRRREK